MNEKREREERDKALWRRLRAAPQRAVVDEAPAPGEMALAAYLDGTLDEAGRDRVEAWLAAAPENLELVLAARAALAEPGVPAPESVVRRAAALVPDPPGSRLPRRWGWLFAPLWQPLGWSGAVAGVLLACVVGFELGQIGYQSTETLEQLDVAEAAFMFDPADDEIL